MKFEYTTIPVQYSVFIKGKSPVFSEGLIKVSLEDISGGEYIVLQQERREEDPENENVIMIDFDEFKVVLKAVKSLQKHVRDNGNVD